MEFDYQQALLEAMNIVAGARINDLPFDRTIVCSIEDASQAEQGHYRVSDGSTTFDAWAEDTHYNVGQRVYVQIPGNDMTSQKHIIGRYFEAENEMLAYVSPEEKEAVEKQLIWNKTDKTISITSNSIETALGKQDIGPNSLDSYNGLRLDVDITCPLGEYTILSGNYGIKIECYYQDVTSPVLLYFDSQEDIFGNPYDIEVATSFTQTYFVPSYLDQGDGAKPLKYIVPYIYQKGNFLYRDNDGAAKPLTGETITFNSIAISQICDVSIYEDDTALLASSEALTYTPLRNGEEWNADSLKKTLKLTFIHKTKENKSIGFADGAFTTVVYDVDGTTTTSYLALDTAHWQGLEASIKALQLDIYEVQATAVIDNGLVDEHYQSDLTDLEEWRQAVLDMLETDLTEFQIELDKIAYAIVWKRKELDGTWKIYEDAYTDINLEVECLPTAQTTDFVVEVWRSGKKIASNSITFTNTEDVFGADVGRKNIDVFLTHGEKSQKTYPFYDAQGHILQQGNMSTERTLQWGYKASSGYAGTIENPKEFFKGWKVEWHIPKTATSLRPPQNHKWTSIKNEYIYSVTIENDIADSYLKYTITEWHIISNVNNTIRCIITDPLGNVYPKEGELKEDFIFSTFGNSGTDYSLVISEKNNKPAYTGDDKDYELQARLYDKDGKDITPEKGIKVTTSIEPTSGNYSVATAEATVDWQGKNVKAKTIYPIAWRSQEQYIYNGPVYIYYDSNNTNPTYNQTLELISASNRIAKWELRSNDDSGEREHYNFQIEANELKVPSIYTSELHDAQICIVALIDNQIVYKQPLIITQNQWSSQLFNEWNGELAIDNKGNYILSAMLGAGKKNSDNTFTGVIMGDIGKLGDTAMSNMGLYGLQDGVQTFGFKTDGTGFIGRNDGGSIEFDGEHGVIKSSGVTYSAKSAGSYEYSMKNNQGSLWDLDSGDLILQHGDKEFFKFTIKDGLDISTNKLQIVPSEVINENLIKGAHEYTESAPFKYDREGGRGEESTQTELIFKNLSVNLKKNVTYCFSAVGTSGYALKLGILDANNEIKILDEPALWLTTGERASINFSLSENISNAYICVPLYYLEDKEHFEFYNIKIEEGKTPTEWISEEEFRYPTEIGMYIDSGRLNINANHITGGVLSSSRVSNNGEAFFTLDLNNASIHTDQLSFIDGEQSASISATGLSIGTQISLNTTGCSLESPTFVLNTTVGSTQTLYTCYQFEGARTPSGTLHIRSGKGTSNKSYGQYQFKKGKTYFSTSGSPRAKGWIPIILAKPKNGSTVVTDASNLPQVTKEANQTLEAALKEKGYIGYVYYEGTSGSGYLFAKDAVETHVQTGEGATTRVSGANLYLSETENYFIIGKPPVGDATDSDMFIKIGGHSTYALQIGTFKVKWDGTVEQ